MEGSAQNDLHGKVIKATKWSTITELAAKLITPISTIVLARVLTPDAFGILVMATMVISFAEIFTDAGFQKYLIQFEFKDQESLYRSTNVAFISNLVMSIFLWVIIIIFSPWIAEIVGSKGYGLVISVSSACIPLAAFSSIQMALFKRHFDFKTLFIVRIAGILIPLVITIPLAFIFRSYWALIIGMIALNLSNAVILTVKSSWKPRLWYDWQLFKAMFSFTFWSMMEAVTIWLTSYADIFIVGRMLDDYYLGIYRTSMSTVGQIIGIITAAVTPIVFSSLSRLQSNEEEFQKVFFKFQKVVSIIVIPLGVGLYIFRNLVTEILLGSQWHSAAYFIGLWALSGALIVVFSHFSSEVYRSKGRPALSAISQIIHIAFIIPVVIWAIPHGFKFLCEWRSIVRLQGVLSSFFFMYFFIKINPLKMLKNVLPACIASLAMWLFSLLYDWESGYPIQILYVFISIAVYFIAILPFNEERHLLFNMKKILRRS